MWRWPRIMWLCVSSTFVLDSETPIFEKHFNVTPTIVSKFLWKVKSVILQLLKEYSYFYKFQIALFYFNLEWCLEVETSPNNVQFKPSPSPSVWLGQILCLSGFMLSTFHLFLLRLIVPIFVGFPWMWYFGNSMSTQRGLIRRENGAYLDCSWSWQSDPVVRM